MDKQRSFSYILFLASDFPYTQPLTKATIGNPGVPDMPVFPKRLTETQRLGSSQVLLSVSLKHGLTCVHLTPSMTSLLEVQELYLEIRGGEQMVTRVGKPKSSSWIHANLFSDRDSLETLFHLANFLPDSSMTQSLCQDLSGA